MKKSGLRTLAGSVDASRKRCGRKVSGSPQSSASLLMAHSSGTTIVLASMR